MFVNKDITIELKENGADFVHFVDVSQLPDNQTKQFPRAILIGVKLSPQFIEKVSCEPNYLENINAGFETKQDEFHQKERKADGLADYIAEYLISKGYLSQSQSEANIVLTESYNERTKSTDLPHKTIALLSGVGWIGKHNLLVNPDFGSAVCLCAVLTNAPLETKLNSQKYSQCGNCEVCKEICPENAIKGNAWEYGKPRDELVDVNKCSPCLKCLALCPWTQKYMKASY